MVWPAIIGGGLSLLGGILGSREAGDVNEYNAHVTAANAADSLAYARERDAKNEALQREFAQHGIRWRVEDAKAAGLHPLFALSGSGASYSPSVSVSDGGSRAMKERSGLGESISSMGQNVARALAAVQTDDQRAESELRRRLLEAQIGESDARAAVLRSQAVRPAQAGVGFPSVAGEAESFPYREVEIPEAIQLSPAGNYAGGFPGKFDTIKPKPVEIESVSADAPFTMAGPARAGLQRYRLTRNMELLLPYNQEGWTEGLESLPYALYPMVYQANRDYYGPDIWRLMLQEMGPDNAFTRWLRNYNFSSEGGSRYGPVSGQIRR